MDKIRLFTLPNLLTSLNLLCGCMACIWALYGSYETVLVLVIASAVFDFFDGLVARAMHIKSRIGLELDSLADDISFGLVPSMVVFSLLGSYDYSCIPEWAGIMLPYTAFAIAIFSALRLAKFNIDERQTTSFIGLPTPANTLLWVALAAGCEAWLKMLSPVWLIAGVAISSFLLVCELPMFSLKLKSMGWHDNRVRYVFVITSLIIIALTGVKGIALAIIWYILISLLLFIKQRNHVSH